MDDFQPRMKQATCLAESSFFHVSRQGRFLVVELKCAAHALTTSHLGGGARDDLRFFVNHQSCEGAGHGDRAHKIVKLGQKEYHRQVCEELGLPADQTALMGTAANMQYATIKRLSFEDLEVCAIVTAGVQGNAGRVGDPAHWHEKEGQWVNVSAQAGTINTILLINQPLLPAALLRAVVTATEAKTAALQELAVGSRFSKGLATGTGTDQLCIASLNQENVHPLTWSGKHTKLGELIGCSVKEASIEAMKWQNGLEPSRLRSLIHALERFGLSENVFRQKQKELLSLQELELLNKNINAVIFEPQVSACAYALAGVLDRIAAGTYPEGTCSEIIHHQCSLMAVVLSAQLENFEVIEHELDTESGDVCDWVCRAIALGWKKKWQTN